MPNRKGRSKRAGLPFGVYGDSVRGVWAPTSWLVSTDSVRGESACPEPAAGSNHERLLRKSHPAQDCGKVAVEDLRPWQLPQRFHSIFLNCRKHVAQRGWKVVQVPKREDLRQVVRHARAEPSHVGCVGLLCSRRLL